MITCRLAAALTVLAASTACGGSQPWTVSLPQSEVRPVAHLDAIASYDRAVATIAEVFEREFAFAPFPVTFRFYPGHEAFEGALLESGYDPKLAKDTAQTMAAIGGHRQVLLNEKALTQLSWPGRVAMLSHELTHSLQYEWGGGVRGRSDQWLREGFAEWIAARVLERLGAISVAGIRDQKFGMFRTMNPVNTPRLDEMATFPAWVEVNNRSGVMAYAYAFLAVDFLIERHGLPAVVRYFELFGRTPDRTENFRTAFREEIPSFEKALLSHLLSRRR